MEYNKLINKGYSMTVLTDNFNNYGGKLPCGKQTYDLNTYTAEWNKFSNQIESLMNSNCSIIDLLEIPFSPKEIRVSSKSSNDNKKFNLPIWAAKKLINKKEYVMEEHDINNLYALNQNEFERKLRDAFIKKNYDFIKIVFDFDNFQFKDRLDKKLINNLLKDSFEENNITLVKFLYTNYYAKKLIDINDVGDAFNGLCAYGKTNIIKYLVSHTNMKEQIKKDLFNFSLDNAVHNEHMEVVKILMNIPKIDIMMSEKKYNLVKNNMKDFENKIVKKNSI